MFPGNSEAGRNPCFCNFESEETVIYVKKYFCREDFMKYFPAVVIALCIVPLDPSFAQESYHAQRRDRHDAFGSKLERLIDDFLSGISRDFSTEQSLPDTLPPANRENEDIDQWRKSGNSLTFDGHKTIQEDDTIEANIVVKGGDLTVYGTVIGDVLVVGGTLYVKDGGSVSGNARVINGELVKEYEGFVGGYMDKTSASTADYRYDRGRFTRSSYRLNAQWRDELTNLDNFIYRFNRVEGHFFGLGSEKKYYWDGSRSYTAYGSLGWGFRSHRWRYNLGVARQFSLGGPDDAGSILELGVEGHSITDSKDRWLIGTNENTVAAILIHEDFRDYYGREGFSLQSGYYRQEEDFTAQLRVEYYIDRYSSLEKRTEWAIFGGRKRYRENPFIDEGKMRSVVVTPGLSTVSKTSRGPEGWSITGTAEFSKRGFGSDFNFSQLVFDVRRYQPLSRYDSFNFRLRAGTSGGRVPVQKIFELGGLSTLHARPFKSETGNRMILLNTEYIVNGDFLHDLDFWPSWLMRRVNFIFVGDVGLIRMVPDEQGWTGGFEGIRLSEFRSDVGIGLANRSGSFRVGFVWRTDVSAPGRFFFRFSRPF